MRESNVAILGAPLDLGAGRRGVDMGPSALRLAGLNTKLNSLGYTVDDLGNVAVEQQESTPSLVENARYLPQIAATCERLAAGVRNAMEKGKFPLVLGGDHSVAVGTVSGVSEALRSRSEKVGLLWIDAHADMNTPESSPSGNVPGVTPFTMRDIDELGLLKVIREAIGIVTNGTAGFHLSFDMDFVDPMEAPGVGTPVRGGVTYREAHLAMESICDCNGMVSMELVEVNPVLDEANRTALLAVELIMSAMGKRIL
jgi:arginase